MAAVSVMTAPVRDDSSDDGNVCEDRGGVDCIGEDWISDHPMAPTISDECIVYGYICDEGISDD